MNLNKIRQEIPALQKSTYMNTGWSGPSPTRVLDRIRQTLEQEAAEGPATPKFLLIQEVIFDAARKAVAAFLNADEEEIALTQSTTEGLNIVVNGLPWKQGDQVITFNLEHSSVLMPLFFLQQRYGVRIDVIELSPRESPEGILAKVREALSLDTKLVALSHIQYSCGLPMPLKEIGELVRDSGIHLLVDGAQAVGQMPVDLHDLGCDFYALPGQKWLLGPEGVGALYIRKELIPQVAPTAVSSSAVTQWDPAGNYLPQETSMRKFHLTTQSAALAAGLVEAINFIQEIGVAEIQQRTLALASQLKQLS